MPEEVQERTVKRGRAVSDFSYITLLELMTVVMTAYVVIDMRREKPCRRGEAVMMRAKNEAAATWVRRCRGGRKKQARVRDVGEDEGIIGSKGSSVLRQDMCVRWIIG